MRRVSWRLEMWQAEGSGGVCCPRVISTLSVVDDRVHSLPQVLEEAVNTRIEANSFESRADNKMWLVRHLEVGTIT